MFTSAGMLSGPADLPFFNCKTVFLMYVLDGFSQLRATGNSSIVGFISAVSLGGGLFNS